MFNLARGSVAVITLELTPTLANVDVSIGVQPRVLLSAQVLADIFGKKAASSIVSGASMKKDVKKRKSSGGAGKSEEVTRAQALAASRTVEVSEVKKYAGKEIL